MARSRASSAPCSITCTPSATSDASWTGTLVSRPCCPWVDYCNSLLVGQSATALRGLQLAQNYAARPVMGLRRSDHVPPALEALHWLPIHQRVCYKLMCLLYRTLYTNDAPVYMSSMVSHYMPGRALRSASATMRVAVPRLSGLCRPLFLGVGSLLSGMHCLLTSITVRHSGLLKPVLKLIYLGNILVKHQSSLLDTPDFLTILKLIYSGNFLVKH